MQSEVPKNLDWVTARSECSLVSVFRSLEEAVRGDVEKIQKTISPNSEARI
jgi:hypothetical protein